MTCSVSVIIPVCDETRIINRTLAHLKSLPFSGNLEILVVDGHPDRTTLKAVRDDVRVLKIPSEKGRGVQMNTGAAIARGDILLFLHADTLLPYKGLEMVAGAFRDKRILAGAFDLCIDSPRKIFRFIEKAASVRSRLTRIPYGDQAIFVERNFFMKTGGFQAIPVMEDVDFMRRIRQNGGRIAILPATVRTSPRRWEQEGIIYGTLRNRTLILLYMLGMSPERLARFYR